MPRRLAVARHAEGTSPVGWVLIGVLLGAAIAIFALSHADWIKRLPEPMTATGGPAATAPVQATAAAPTPTTAASPMMMAVTAAAPASDSPAGPDPTQARTSNMPSAPAPGDEAQVEEDAAAAGMTSHSAKPDLN